MLAKARAPGSLVLFGEHAVLHGQHAIVAAIDRFIDVEMNSRNDQTVNIHSSLGDFCGNLNTLSIAAPFEFVIACIKQISKQHQLPGLDIYIRSDMRSDVGFGSSAAVTIATLEALWQLLQLPNNKPALLEQALIIKQEVQGGLGSGCDLAASCYQQTILYQRKTQAIIKPLPHPYHILASYCGYKTKTATVIQHIAKTVPHAKQQAIYQDMEQATLLASNALMTTNDLLLQQAIETQQQALDALGVNNTDLQRLIDANNQHKGIISSKISGSGLGDCVISFYRDDIANQVTPQSNETQFKLRCL